MSFVWCLVFCPSKAKKCTVVQRRKKILIHTGKFENKKFLKAGLIMAFFMHLFWERYAIVNVLLWPMTAIACFVGLMVAEGKYTLFSRFFYFFVGG